MAEYHIARCVACKRTFVAIEGDEFYCCRRCAKTAERDLKDSYEKKAEIAAAGPRVEELIRLLRKDPSLEHWQLRERGWSSVEIQQARKAITS